MLLTLYDQYGNEKAELQANDSSTQDKEVQADNVLSLGFTLYEHVSIDVNDYVDFGGERYWAVEKYEPTEKSSVEWEYSLKLYGIESLIKRFLVLNNTDGENEAVFTLTARPVDHVRLIVKCINDGMGQTTNFKVGSVEGTDNVVINYEGKYCDEALKELAAAVGVEWWFDGETVNLSRCEWGSAVELGYGEGLTSLEQDKADNVKFYTRLFPIGSSRNIDRERYGASRLQLPGGAKYVDLPDLVQKYGVIHHYEQEAFSGIYPRRVGVVSSVRSREVQDSDGKPYTIYYFKDNSLTFDPNDYEIGGLVKHVSFQEGSELAGLGTDNDHYFEVNFDSETREFEIITIWPYDDDRQLPGDTLVPKPGDKYILWNIRMPDDYYTLAENEFQTAVEAYNRKHTQDVSRYKAPTDHVWIEETGTELEIGRRVRLKSQEYFPGPGYRESRITRISRSVNLPSQMDLEISDALSSGALEKIDDAISDAKSYAGSILGAVNVPDVIKSWEDTKPTDNNLYSARRTHKEFLSKNTTDRAKKKIIFDEGIEFGTFTEGVEGGRVWQDGDGNWHFEADYVSVRKKFSAKEVDVQEVSHVGGQHMLTAANMTCDYVEEVSGGWRCYFSAVDGDGREVKNLWRVGDQAHCQTFNLEKQSDGSIGNRYYWRLVTEVGTLGEYHYITLSSSDCAEGSMTPMVGDKIVQLGYRKQESETDTEAYGRQSAIVISGAGNSAPSIDEYAGISTYSLEGTLENRMKPGDNIFTGRFAVQKGSVGAGNFADLPEAVLKSVEVGAENLLRNTGFDGEHESAELTQITQISPNTPLYSDELQYWEGNGESVEVQESVSGRGVYLTGSLQQDISLIQGERYIVGLVVKSGEVSVSCGEGYHTFSAESVRQTFGFSATGHERKFVLSGQGATIYDLKLERGTVGTDWCPAREDNDPVADKFRGLWYLQQALKEGKTDILGGLVLSSLINLGQYKDGVMEKVTAGMSGVYGCDDDVAFWGGGTLEQAIRAITMFKDNPGYTPTQEELAQIANVVFTHGGRGILNDIILRGYVYALGGVFNGTVYAKDGEFNGTIRARNGNFSGFLQKEPFYITKDNRDMYMPVREGGRREIRYSETGTFLILDSGWGVGSGAQGVDFRFPSSRYTEAGVTDGSNLQDSLTYIGNKVVMIVKDTTPGIFLFGHFSTSLQPISENSFEPSVVLVNPYTETRHKLIVLECRHASLSTGVGYVYWYYNKSNLL